MKKILLWLLEKSYSAELKEWKQEKLESDKVVDEFYRKYFSRTDYDKNKKCSGNCGRSVNNCRCMDRAFGY